MATNEEPIPELRYLSLKVLEEYDEDRREWLATCIETGTVAAAPDQATLQQLIQDTIRLEILLAIQKGNLPSLFRKPASGEARVKWLRAAAMSPHGPTDTTLEINFNLPPPRREVKSEIKVKTVSLPRSA